ncbi:hypothetical protein CDAR_197291 [Caerostris darwini]|uniref:Uncharacterized protein n=1 Tax=Caerostris darwini TaxID=1538125 RepID=A0AAV4RA43_9ARAC|nr:hypothetical protein CDAR_197291 [Caerostris darwini]
MSDLKRLYIDKSALCNIISPHLFITRTELGKPTPRKNKWLDVLSQPILGQLAILSSESSAAQLLSNGTANDPEQSSFYEVLSSESEHQKTAPSLLAFEAPTVQLGLTH